MTPELGTPSQADILVNRGALVGVHIGVPRSQSARTSECFRRVKLDAVGNRRG